MVPEQAMRQVEKYCASRVPEGLEDEIKVEASRRGKTITIAECRPPWKPELGPEWSEIKLAQLRFDDESGTWSLYCSDSNGRWWKYDRIGPAQEVTPLLKEIDADPTGIFWG